MQYELIYIIDTALEEEARNQLIARFNELIEQNGGSVQSVEEWGRRRLAYLINDKPEGYYVMVHFTSAPEVPKEIERNLGITEGILRYLTTRVEVKKSSVKPRAVPQPVQRAEVPAAPVAPAAPAAPEAPPAQE